MQEPLESARSEEVLRFWRDRDARMIVGFVGVVIGAAGLLQFLLSTWHLGAALVLIGAAFGLWARSGRTHLDVHRVAFMALVFAIWAAALIGVGWTPGTVAGGTLFVTNAGVLLGRRVMWTLLGLIAGFALTVALAVYSGALPPPAGPASAVGEPGNWVVTGGVTMLCLLLGTFMIRRSIFLHGSLLARLQNTVELLETQAAERGRLRSEEADLLTTLNETWGVRVASAVGPALGHVFNNALTAGLAASETAHRSGDKEDALEAARVVDEVVDSCFEGAGYLLSLARPSDEDSEPADVASIGDHISSIRARIRENVAVEVDLAASGLVSLTQRQFEELTSLLLTHAATQLPSGGTVICRTYRHDHTESQTLETGDWVVFEATARGELGPPDAALVAILVETARRAGAVVQYEHDDDAETTSVFLPRSIAHAPVRAINLPVSDHRALNAVLGVAAFMTMITAIVMALHEPDRELMWLGLGMVTFAPLIWGALTPSLSVRARLAAFAVPLTTVATLTLIVDGFERRPLSVAVLSAVPLAVAAYGSRRTTIAALATVALAWVVGAVVHVDTPLAPPFTGIDWIRYSVLIPVCFALAALITSAPVQRVQAILETLDDVRERLESQRAGLHEADQALSELRAARAREDEMAIAGRDVTVLAHDMNNCLTVMGGWGSLIPSYADDPEALSDAVDATYQACRHAQAIVESFGRDDADRPLKPVDLNATLTRTRLLLVALLQHDTQRLELELDPSVGWVLADEQLLRRVLLNLITNASAAIDRDGCIRVLSRAGDVPTVLVVDDGHGMDDETAARAVEPLFTTKGHMGTGLGLHSALTVMQGFGGALDIDTKPGGGTTVRLDFVPTEARRSAFGEQTPFELRRLLIVDDEPLIVRALSRGLQAAGIYVREAANGDDALELIEVDGPFDALCCDIVMPGTRADVIVEEFRRANQNSRVILMSGYSPPDIRDSGGVTFLHKPFSTEDLLRALADPVGAM